MDASTVSDVFMQYLNITGLPQLHVCCRVQDIVTASPLVSLLCYLVRVAEPDAFCLSTATELLFTSTRA